MRRRLNYELLEDRLLLVADITTGLVGHWQLDETTIGAPVIDSSGLGHNGVHTNLAAPQGPSTNIALGDPATSRSLQLDGVDDYVDVAGGANLDLSGGQFSQSLWIYSTIDDNGFHGVLGHQGTSNAQRYPGIWIFEQTKIHAGFGDGTTWDGFFTGAVITPGQWNHVVTTFDGTYYKVYVDSVEVNSSTLLSGRTPHPTQQLDIGRIDNYFDGNLDNVRIYTRALTSEDIAALYNLAPDTTAPTAALTNLTRGANFDFTVVYTDDVAIDVSTLDASDLRVTGPAGYDQLATFVSVDVGTDGSPREALYQVAASAGQGTYTISLEANQIADTTGNLAVPASLGTFVVNDASSEPDPSGLVAHWRLDETAIGQTVADASGFGNDGIHNNIAAPDGPSSNVPTVFSPGSQSLSVDGVDDYVASADHPSLDLSDGQFTQSLWLYPTGTSNGFQGILGADVPLPQRYPSIWVFEQTKIHAGFGDGNSWNGFFTGDVLTQNQWNHVALTFNGTNYLVYVDGALVHTDPLLAGRTPHATQQVDIGRVNDGSNFDGQIDDVRIYKRVLDAAEIGLLNSPGADTTAPTANVTVSDITSQGATTHTFNVTYTDNAAVDVATLDGNDILVTGPGGYSQLATLDSVDIISNGTPRVATYSIAAPGGTWDDVDNGTYSVVLQAGQVRDVAGNAAAAGSLGTFDVAISANGVMALAEEFFTVNETDTTLTVTVERTGGTSGTVTVDYTTVDDTATGGADYVVTSGTLTFVDGQATETFDVPLLDDTVGEGIEKFSISLTGVSGGAVLGFPRTGEVTILDDDQLPSTGNGLLGEYYDNADLTNLVLTRTDPEIDFGWGTGSPDSAIGADTFSVRWSGKVEPLLTETHTFYTTTNDGVRLSVDGQLLIDQWIVQSTTEYSATIDLIAGQRYDIQFEFFEDTGTASAKLEWSSENQPREVIPQEQLYDGSAGPPIVSFASGNFSSDESDVTTSITVVRTGNAADPVSVDFGTSDGTATGPDDYTPFFGRLDFAAGETVKSIAIPILNDTVTEPNETINVVLSAPVGGVLGQQPATTATIFDDDPGEFIREDVLTGLRPLAFDWLPDGRMLIAQQSGVVRVLDNGTLQPTPFIDLSAEVNYAADRGLLGMAVHPNFPTDNYVYLLYTYDPPDVFSNSGLAGPDGDGNRVARLVRVEADPATNYTTADLTTKTVILGTNSTWQNISHPEIDSTNNFSIGPSCGPDGTLQDCIPADSLSHTVGTVRFGLDGSLFVSSGDGTSFGQVDPRTVRVQDVNSLSGKMLRINPDTGQGYATNPFYDGVLDSNASKVYSYGLRNPFRFTIHPVTGEPFIGDVGWTKWEEINTGAGANFGWPYYEGGNGVSLQQITGYQNLPEAQAFYASGELVVPSIYARNHNDGARALIMGDFYTGTSFPAIYQGALFHSDANEGTLDVALFDQSGQVEQVQRFASDIFGIVQTSTGPDGHLYFANIGENKIERFRYDTGGGGPPVIPRGAARLESFDGTLLVKGLIDDDMVFVDAAQMDTITVNDVTYTFPSPFDRIEITGEGGSDAITVTATTGNDTARLRRGGTVVTGPGYEINAEQFVSVTVDGVSGAGDRAYLFDTTGDDTFTAFPTSAQLLTSDGNLHTALSFKKVYAYATLGGANDEAVLYDDITNDLFTGRSDFSFIRGPGFSFYNYAKSFDRVTAIASLGTDRANLNDSTGNDVFTAEPTFGLLHDVGLTYSNRAEGFDKVYAYARFGGVDEAFLTDSSAADRFIGQPTYAFLRGPNLEYYNYASTFERVNAFASDDGNTDRAYLYDSAGNDYFEGRPEFSFLRGENSEYLNYADGFDRVYAYATKGGTDDLARFYDSTGDDRFVGRPDYSLMRELNNAFYNYAKGFDRVEAFATAGGTDDRAFVYDSPFDDLYFGRSNFGYLTGPGFYNYVEDFEKVVAVRQSTGTDVLDVDALDYIFTALGDWV